MVDIREITMTTRLLSQLWTEIDEHIETKLWQELRSELSNVLTPELFLQFDTVFQENMEYVV